jgi:hypothetical protein
MLFSNLYIASDEVSPKIMFSFLEKEVGKISTYESIVSLSILSK